MSSKLKALFGIVTVLVALVLLASSTYAYTQGNTLMATMRGQTAVAGGMGSMGGMMGGHMGGPMMGHGPRGGGPMGGMMDREAMQEALAKALGVSVDELEAARAEGKTIEDLAAEKGVDMATVQAAMEAARAEAIAQAVTDGTITQAQADQMLSHEWQPGGPMGHGPRGGGPMGGVIDHEAMKATLATALGVTVDELKAARAEGKTIEDLAAEKGVDMADVQAAMDAAHAEAIAQAVADGTITQAQADEMLSHTWQANGPMGHGGPGGGLLKDIIDREAMKATLATALGVTVDELKAARSEGKTIEDLAAEKGVDMADVQAAMEAARAEAIAQAVADGKITQAQADQMLSHEWQPGGPHGHGNCPNGNLPAEPNTLPADDTSSETNG